MGPTNQWACACHSILKASLGTTCYVSRNTNVTPNPQFTLVTAGIFDYIQYLKESYRLVLATGMQTFWVTCTHTYTKSAKC